MSSFADRARKFFNTLELQLPSSLGIDVLNPYHTPGVKAYVAEFFLRYYNDSKERTFILGINPGRFGGGVTGISFTDPYALRHFCGIENGLGDKRELSSEFIYRLIEIFGGVQKFYNSFYLGAICPLGFVKGSKNFNYYDDKKLLECTLPFIEKTFVRQAEIGANHNALIVIGSDKNRKQAEALNSKFQLFDKIESIEHPRFIMQYRRKKLDEHLQQYIKVLAKYA